MSNVTLIEYADASADVRAVYDDIMASRGLKDVNNFWKGLAHDPKTLKRTWESLKDVMAPNGALDPVTKEMLYLAVSMANNCEYCMKSHRAAARKAGMNDDMLKELIAIVGMASETNALVRLYQVPVDEAFDGPIF